MTHIITNAVVKNKSAKDKDWAIVIKLIKNPNKKHPIVIVLFISIIIIDFFW